jgi:salicylate hydroxylase
MTQGKENDISLLIYTPDSPQDGTWTQETEKQITDVLGPCDKQWVDRMEFQQHAYLLSILKMAALAGPATCLQIKQHYDLESWVSKSGRVLVLGDAAHPFPVGTPTASPMRNSPCNKPGSAQTYAVALEDGKFIGKIFSHTVNPARVPEFLRAFQEHREPRCTRIRQMEKEYIYYITLPDGQIQEERDASMRERHAAGQNVFEGDLEQLQEDLRMVYVTVVLPPRVRVSLMNRDCGRRFGYEASDDADEWWMAWGRYRDPAEASPLSPGTQSGLFDIKFSTSTSQAEAGESAEVTSGEENDDNFLVTKFEKEHA